MSQEDEEAAGAGVVEDGRRRFVGKVSRENELGRRKRYSLFLPLPGHVGGPTRANVWDAEDVNAHVRFANSLEFAPSEKPSMPKELVHK